MRASWMISVLGCLLALASACGGASGPGEGDACTASNSCGTGLSCVADATGSPRCMLDCVATTATCDDGAACVSTGGSDAVCWLGGATVRGAACTGGLQCERGAVCVTAAGAVSATCEQACEPPSAEFCGLGQVCSATAGGGGFCATGP